RLFMPDCEAAQQIGTNFPHADESTTGGIHDRIEFITPNSFGVLYPVKGIESLQSKQSLLWLVKIFVDPGAVGSSRNGDQHILQSMWPANTTKPKPANDQVHLLRRLVGL